MDRTDGRSASETQGVARRGWQPQAFSHLVTDENQIDHLNASGGIAVDFKPLTRQRIHLSFDGRQSRSLCLWRTTSRSGFVSTPKFEADLLTVRFVQEGSILRQNTTAEAVSSSAGAGMLVGFDNMRDEIASHAFSAISATVSKETFERASRQFYGAEPVDVRAYVPSAELRTMGLQTLRHMLVTLYDWLRQKSHDLDMVGPMLEEIIVYQLVSAWPTVVPSAKWLAEGSRRDFVRALDFMEANITRPISILEVAQASGMTVRALQIVFKREVGCSPIAYLIGRRLDGAREALMNSQGESVKNIAARWGFVHMGDFARRFKARFGVLPGSLRMKL